MLSSYVPWGMAARMYLFLMGLPVGFSRVFRGLLLLGHGGWEKIVDFVLFFVKEVTSMTPLITWTVIFGHPFKPR